MWVKTRPTTSHAAEVRDKGAQAFYLIRDNPPEAERLLREALELEPDAPDLLNNLAMALRGQGKHAEATRTPALTHVMLLTPLSFPARVRRRLRCDVTLRGVPKDRRINNCRICSK